MVAQKHPRGEAFFSMMSNLVFYKEILHKILVKHGGGFCWHNFFDHFVRDFLIKLQGIFTFSGHLISIQSESLSWNISFCVDKHAKYNCHQYKWGEAFSFGADNFKSTIREWLFLSTKLLQSIFKWFSI